MVRTSGRMAAGRTHVSHHSFEFQITGTVLPYQRHRVAQQDVSRRVVGQVICDFVEALVHGLVFVLFDLLRCLIDHVWPGDSSASSAYRAGLLETDGGDIHTDDGLWVVGSRGSQAKLAKVVLRVLREGV